MLKLKFKRTLLQQTKTGFKLNEHQEEIYKQHDSTFRRAKSGTNLTLVGPFNRQLFPLLKGLEKDKEFFVRTGKYTVIKYFMNEFRQQNMEHLFYPTDKAIAELEDLRRSGKEDDHFVLLYNKLVVDGSGSTYMPKTKKPNNRKVMLKRATPTPPTKGRIQLKKKETKTCKRVTLKKKAKRLSLRK